MSKQNVIVIGSGLGGLAAACTLAARGHSVRVLEANEWLGGKAAVCAGEGFRFDMGPTILTVPRVLGRIFAEAERNIHDYLDLRRLDPQWRCFFDDGSVLDLVQDSDEMEAELQRFTGGTAAGKGYREFLELARRLARISDKFFFWRAIDSVRDTFDGSGTFKPGTLRDLWDLRMGRSVAGVVRSHVPEPRVAQMLDHFTQYVGSSPYGSPAVLCGIAQMQVGEGVWYPIGGTRAVPEALVGLGEELGVKYHTNTEVKRIVVEDGRARGVVTAGGERLHADQVVSNMDSVRTFAELIGGEPAEKFAARRDYEPACSGVVLYLGLDRAYDHLLHHNFVFSQSPEEEFEAIYEQGIPAPDPTCYLAATTRTEPATAPPGGEALYVLVHTPYLRPGQNWNAMFPGYRQVILDKLKRCGGMPDLEERIVFERALTPQDIHERYRVLDGAIYGLASHGRFFGAFKPSNRSGDVAGLYLAGGAAHPGPGMPMVLMSGWIAADALDSDVGGAGAAVAPTRSSARTTTEAPPQSATMRRGFGRFLKSYFRRHFNAVRVAHDGLPMLPAGEPVIICANHPAWWDPITLLLAQHCLFPGRRGYGPIDAAALEKYGILEKLGLFGVDRDSPASIREFLRVCDAILAQPDAALGITAQGEFVDPRTRPVRIEPGVAHLLRRHPAVPLVPVALEYPFWNERAPETLLRFGRPATAPPQILDSTDALSTWVADMMTANMDRLAELARTRDASRFHTLVEGRKGVGGVYDALRRLRAMFGGERFDASHAAATRKARG